ncbi:FKBP-type peptidyl-prolyl cis-trans isomerase [Lewinella sp. W8]|nr:FKBP-type peptidyl-prolyl cis-trans isomerase [Lewinella sp. W8]MTB50976.1 FKBP-type peptidyl-prolyl cis-trans isomerase [Lewinella sp. W8]
MKHILLGIVLCLCIGPIAAQNTPTKMDTISYALGVVLSQNLKSQGFTEVNASELAKGFEEGLSGAASMDVAAANSFIQKFLREKQELAGAEARKAGEDFLAENAKRPEVKVTDSGLQYEVLTEGTGASPSATQTVKVHYHGTLIDGTVFDSSVERGETIEFPLNRVISGWTEGLQLMKEGAKYRFYIPYDLAYGPRGSAPKIPPYAALIFDVELFQVK